MAIDSQLLEWFNATVLVESAVGSSSGGYGGRKYSAASSALARIEQFISKAVSHEGQDADTRGRLFVAPFDVSGTSSSVSITPRDRITIPSGYILGASTQPRIINVEQLDDEYGAPSYYEVLV